jgi:hypothetical protein
MNAYWGVEVQLHEFFDLGTRWKWIVSFMPRPLYAQGNGVKVYDESCWWSTSLGSTVKEMFVFQCTHIWRGFILTILLQTSEFKDDHLLWKFKMGAAQLSDSRVRVRAVSMNNPNVRRIQTSRSLPSFILILRYDFPLLLVTKWGW